MDQQILEDSRVNDLSSYTDEAGITHIHILDTDEVFELVGGEWIEKAPF